jgi:glutamate/tyrosine decarboxylase-like PLP-dependent enzyme
LQRSKKFRFHNINVRAQKESDSPPDLRANVARHRIPKRQKQRTKMHKEARTLPKNPKDPFRRILTDACERAQAYLATINDRRVGVPQAALDGMLALGGALPTNGEPPETVIRLLDEAGSPATMAIMGGRFFGGVIGGSLPVTVAAHWLADAWDQNACLYNLSPVSAYLEEVVLDWLVDVLGLPPGSAGALVTGTQMADMTALAAARHALLSRAGWDVGNDGLFGAPPISVVVGEEVHATMLKALALLGLGRNRVHVVSCDSQGRMKPTHIPWISGPLIICAQVGNVNTGACDPIGDICEVAESLDAWVHVDGAFGLWAAASPTRKHLVEGVARADSWATDAHKWLNTPQDCGIAIVREADALRNAMSINAPYYGPLSKREPMQWCPESSRRARAVEIWAALRTLGRRGVAELIEQTCQHAKTIAQRLSAAGHEVLNQVVLNQVLVSFGDNATDRVINAIQEDGTCWCGGTVWKGRKAMRISVSSWATTEADVSKSLDAILAAARG